MLSIEKSDTAYAGFYDFPIKTGADAFTEKPGETELSEGGADSIETFCQIYYDEALAEGVRRSSI